MNDRKPNKWKLPVALSLVLVVAFGGFIGVRMVRGAQERQVVRDLQIHDQDLSSIHDGNYPGAFTYGGFAYQVEVTIRSYTITDISIISNRTSKYAKMAEGVVQKVLDKGNVNVDVVSGATTTSKALLKAIEQAIACNLCSGDH